MERHEEKQKLNIQSNKKEEALFEGIVLPLCKECFMINRTLKQVEQMTNGTGLAEQYEGITIQGVSIDTRKIEKGNLYVPIRGERFDGHAFVDKAVENGAVATLWMKDVANPPENLPVIFVEDTLSALQMLAKTIATNWMLK